MDKLRPPWVRALWLGWVAKANRRTPICSRWKEAAKPKPTLLSLTVKTHVFVLTFNKGWRGRLGFTKSKPNTYKTSLTLKQLLGTRLFS
ncbi:hypothetical protein CCACVL1_21204 [Corchorus capsularis]|uniref:Uncharacterized protein n=1 Tax=Corchorus capsularis TaxID=210143 RepID=A0A1R3H7I5_COCAP|nr:hypothetical protein CCACVL1_21204 [Corchorus capsularis]